MVELFMTLEFGKCGNVETCFGDGWSAGEEGHRWMIGPTSDFRLDHQPPGHDMVLELRLHPYVYPPALSAQRIIVMIGAVTLGEMTISRPATLGFRIPDGLLSDAAGAVVTFLHPDAACPKDLGANMDDRTLCLSASSGRLWRMPAGRPSMAAHSVPATLPSTTDASLVPAPPEPHELVTQFESLGDNCEFGLVQRRCLSEPLGLLRFANIELRDLLRGIKCGFTGLGDPTNLRLIEEASEQEYIVRDDPYGMTYHTFIPPSEVSRDDVTAQQSVRLQFLARKLMEDVGNGEKCFVLKANQPLTEPEVWPLFIALNEPAPNRLLWVVPASDGHSPGSVEEIVPGLMKGYIDRFAPAENAHDLSFEVWLDICRNAWLLSQPGGQRPTVTSSSASLPSIEVTRGASELHIAAIGDFARGPVEGVEFQSLARPNHALPESPRFIFGTFPAKLSAAYYRHAGIGSVGVFRASNLGLCGQFLLCRDGTFFRCPEMNVHESHIEEELGRLSRTGKPLQEKHLPGQYAALAGAGNRVYGHWLVEYLPKLGLLNAAGYNVQRLRYLIPTSAPSYTRDWLNLLGISSEQIVLYDADSDLVVADELLVPTVMHNGVRMSPLFQDAAAFMLGLISLRHDLRGSTYGPRLFLSRSQTSQSRALVNRDAIEEIAAKEGFAIVRPEELSLLEQVRMFYGARAIVGEYGSALHGNIFSQAGTVVCALRGTYLHPGFLQSGMGVVLRQPTGYVFGETSGGDRHFEFRVDEADFQSCVTLVFNRNLL